MVIFNDQYTHRFPSRPEWTRVPLIILALPYGPHMVALPRPGIPRRVPPAIITTAFRRLRKRLDSGAVVERAQLNWKVRLAMPTKAAIITDVRANLPALTAGLLAIDEAACDAIYCLGDVISIDPAPSECLELPLNRPDVRFVMGNHDAFFAFGLPEQRSDSISEGEEAHQRWTHAQLDPARRDIVATWPYKREESIGPLRVVFLHHPVADAEGDGFHPIVADPAVVELDELFAACRAPLVCYGHHHPPADATGRARYINPGSLGCSRDALARFAALTIAGDGSYRIDHRAAPSDRSFLLRQFEERRVPERATIMRSFFTASQIATKAAYGAFSSRPSSPRTFPRLEGTACRTAPFRISPRRSFVLHRHFEQCRKFSCWNHCTGRPFSQCWKRGVTGSLKRRDSRTCASLQRMLRVIGWIAGEPETPSVVMWDEWEPIV